MQSKTAKRIPVKQPKNRILSVTIRHILDTDPDTSYLGHYTSKIESDYTIDRRHARGCAAQNGQNHTHAELMLGRVIARAYDARIICFEHSHTSGDGCVSCEAESETQRAVDLLEEIQNGLSDCDCGGRWLDRNSYEYFEPNHGNYEGCTETEIRDYCWQDFERMESLENQNWYYMGIRAEARISVQVYAGNPPAQPSVISSEQTLESIGLWGIESDSGSDYIAEEEKNQLADLRDVLLSFGFSRRAIATAFKSIERKDA